LFRGRHLRPEPRIAEALALHGTSQLRAMIDISDGLSSDLGHILKESGGVGAGLAGSAIPIHSPAGAEAPACRVSPLAPSPGPCPLRRRGLRALPRGLSRGRSGAPGRSSRSGEALPCGRGQGRGGALAPASRWSALSPEAQRLRPLPDLWQMNVTPTEAGLEI